jgi:hypothetical protein
MMRTKENSFSLCALAMGALIKLVQDSFEGAWLRSLRKNPDFCICFEGARLQPRHKLTKSQGALAP